MTSANDEPEGFRLRKTTFSTPQQPYSGIPTEEFNDGRQEKPWQKVFHLITKKGLHLYEPIKSVPSPVIVIVLGLYLLLGYLTQLIEDDMPRVVPAASVASEDWQTFSEESALKYLEDILGGKHRVAGTEFHLQKTQDMKELIEMVTANSRLPVRTDWQLATGDFWLQFTRGVVNYYQNASNVIAVLEGESGFNEDGTTRSSILINCHYDSVPFAIGASDNGLFCAAMVEVLSRLSRRPKKFKHNIVFLFNGAEENALQASHAFLQHPWARGVTAVVNLDSAGMNGKPSVFQVTDPRVLSAYRRGAARPSAQSVGEFLFTSGMVPSDTDFRIWRDFGNIQGIDIAFTKWGHVYHTRNDAVHWLKPAVMQNAGATLLGLTIQLADDPTADHKVAPTRVVYMDYLNMFMVTLSPLASQLADVLVAVLGLLSVLYYIWMVGFRWSTVQELMWALAGRLCCVVAGILLPAILVPIMVATTIQMRYLTQPWIVVPMFWLPYVVGTIIMAHIFDAWRTKKSGLNRSIRALQAMAATRLLLSAVVLGLALVPAARPVRYVAAAPLLLMAAAAAATLTALRCARMQGWQHLLLEFVLSIPSVMFMYVLALRSDAMMLPIMARSGSDRPDYTVAAINVGLAVLTSVTVSGMELLFSRRRIWLPLGAVLAACVVIMFIPFSPYQDEGPSLQRHYWFHSEMVTFDAQKQPISRTSGVMITKHDPYTTERAREAIHASGVKANVRDKHDCKRDLYCGLPVFRHSIAGDLSQALFVEMEPPEPFAAAPDVTLTRRTCVIQTCTYYFDVTVTPHSLITIWPLANATLSGWSFQSPLKDSFEMGDRPVYVIQHTVATYSGTKNVLQFSLNVLVPPNLQSQPALRISLHAHEAAPERRAPQYERLVAAAPRYFNIAAGISRRHDYVF